MCHFPPFIELHQHQVNIVTSPYMHSGQFIQSLTLHLCKTIPHCLKWHPPLSNEWETKYNHETYGIINYDMQNCTNDYKALSWIKNELRWEWAHINVMSKKLLKCKDILILLEVSRRFPPKCLFSIAVAYYRWNDTTKRRTNLL